MQHTREVTTVASPNRTAHRRHRNSKRRVNDVPGFKWCPKCEQRLAVDAFGVARNREDGLTGWCRGCRAERSRARRATDPDSYRAETRARYAANPEIWHAKVAVARAVASGKLQRPAPGTPCACGSTEPLEAHHHLGHDKEQWLNVVWRCRSCRSLANADRQYEHLLDQQGAEHVVERAAEHAA